MKRRVDRSWLAAATFLLLLGLALISPTIIFALVFVSHSYTVGFDPTARERLELTTGAGLLLIALGALVLRASFVRRKAG